MLRQLAIAVLLCVVCAAGSAAAVKAGQVRSVERLCVTTGSSCVYGKPASVCVRQYHSI